MRLVTDIHLKDYNKKRFRRVRVISPCVVNAEKIVPKPVNAKVVEEIPVVEEAVIEPVIENVEKENTENTKKKRTSRKKKEAVEDVLEPENVNIEDIENNLENNEGND